MKKVGQYVVVTPPPDPRCIQCGFGSFPGHQLLLDVRYCDGYCKAAAAAGLTPAITVNNWRWVDYMLGRTRGNDQS